MSESLNYAGIRRQLSEISGFPTMAISTQEHIDKIKSEVERLKADLIDRDKALEIARKEIGRLSFELDEMTEHSDHERKLARLEVERLKAKNARMRKIVASTMTEADMRLEGILDDQEGGA